MATLNRAFTLDERHDVPGRVSEQLHFDVARLDDPSFEIDRRIAEGGRRFRTGTADRAAQLFARLHESHAFATASGDGLDHHGIAEAVRDRRDVGIGDLRTEWLVRSRHDGTPARRAA
jgi:hypothetical protein